MTPCDPHLFPPGSLGGVAVTTPGLTLNEETPTVAGVSLESRRADSNRWPLHYEGGRAKRRTPRSLALLLHLAAFRPGARGRLGCSWVQGCSQLVPSEAVA